jgi:hypothetical protein
MGEGGDCLCAPTEPLNIHPPLPTPLFLIQMLRICSRAATLPKIIVHTSIKFARHGQVPTFQPEPLAQLGPEDWIDERRVVAVEANSAAGLYFAH